MWVFGFGIEVLELGFRVEDLVFRFRCLEGLDVFCPCCQKFK